jgi:uncharacterized protein (DUF1810 family)
LERFIVAQEPVSSAVEVELRPGGVDLDITRDPTPAIGANLE